MCQKEKRAGDNELSNWLETNFLQFADPALKKATERALLSKRRCML